MLSPGEQMTGLIRRQKSLAASPGELATKGNEEIAWHVLCSVQAGLQAVFRMSRQISPVCRVRIHQAWQRDTRCLHSPRQHHCYRLRLSLQCS